MSVAIERAAGTPPTSTRPSAAAPRSRRPWIVAGLFPLTALVFVPFVDRILSTSGSAVDGAFIPRTTILGTAVAWNAGLFVLLTTLLVATATDLADRRIRNYLTYPAVLWLVALSVLAALRQPPRNAAEATSALDRCLVGTLSPADTLIGALTCFLIMLFVFVMAGTGGGDVKLCTVIGAALGAELGLTAVVCSHIAAGAVALSWVLLVYGPVRTFGTLGRALGSFVLPLWIAPPKPTESGWMKFPLPMSPFFLIGTSFALVLPR